MTTSTRFLSPAHAAAFHRRVRILARSIGTTHADLMETLEGDAEAIRETRATAEDGGSA